MLDSNAILAVIQYMFISAIAGLILESSLLYKDKIRGAMYVRLFVITILFLGSMLSMASYLHTILK